MWNSHLWSKVAFERSSCLVSEPDCALEKFASNKVYDVHPEAWEDAGCMDGSPYYWQVVRGSQPGKLLLFFQGGGAAWDNWSYNFAIDGEPILASRSVMPDPFGGILNFSDPRNPYFGYSMVVVNYCSGDVHSGSAEHPWGPDNATVRQSGYHNVRSVLRWTNEQFPVLSNLVISGCSAGTLGMQWWSSKILRMFRDRNPQTTAIADSFAGILWPRWMADFSDAILFKTWNSCNSRVLTSALMARCEMDALSVPDVYLSAMEEFPRGEFLSINSKTDMIQIVFEKLFELTGVGNMAGFEMTFADYYDALNLLYQRFNKRPNWRGFLVNGYQHCYTPLCLFYNATPTNNFILITGTEPPASCAPSKQEGKPSMLDWLNSIPSNVDDFNKTVGMLGRSLANGK
eukprot:TRINITY_DN28190_c0_g1_i2.p1 TRINITY_DN28190_c0_g1~~TRINITY_DN28190_c0_g1_i2.p1  ORF type:complete len:401 (-),score=54.10 TRINITY_DN28190_c0_g1_i2:112-1314(-)